MLVLQAMIFGLLIGGTILCFGLYFQPQSPQMRKRLQVPSKKPETHLRVADSIAFLPSVLVERLEEKLGLKKDSGKRTLVKQALTQAGIYGERAASIFIGLKLGLMVALPMVALGLLLGGSIPRGLMLLLLYGLGLLGYFLPDLVVRRLVGSRQKKIKAGLPDVLDLLVVCVEAGQGLNAALKRVADDIMLTNPVLAQELLLVNLEINAGMEREQALRNLGERTGVQDVASLCSILIQSERFGTSVGVALKVQSETLRTTRRQKLEELAAKTPVKLVFPLILFIFPAIMVIILGPAVIKISETILK
jgi:tight adherence protein C